MTTRPIIFSGPMVKALLEGAKTQTRRVLKVPDKWVYEGINGNDDWLFYPAFSTFSKDFEAAYTKWDGVIRAKYRPGDVLWVRETWAPMCRRADPKCWCPAGDESQHYVEYKTDTGNPYPGDWPNDPEMAQDRPRWRSPVHMPRAASRITLRVTDVRVQRLQEISYEDCYAEGVPIISSIPHSAYQKIWESIHGPDSWTSNQWVMALTFERVTP